MVCEKKVVMNVTAFLHTKVCKRSCQWQLLCTFALHDLRLFQFFCKCLIHPDHRFTKEQSKDQGQDQKDSKLSKFCPVGHTIHTANCLPKRRHAVNEWQ